MKHLQLWEAFDQQTYLKKFLNRMYGNLKRSYGELDQESKDELNNLVNKLYNLDNKKIDIFMSKLAKYRNSWSDMIEYLEEFVAANLNDQLSQLLESPYLIASKGGVYLFSFSSFDSWLDFLTSADWLYKEIKWPLNPKISDSAQQFFDMYLKKFPIFCFIIDNNKNNFYGASLDSSGNIGVFVDKLSQPQKNELLPQYLDGLNLTIEDL